MSRSWNGRGRWARSLGVVAALLALTAGCTTEEAPPDAASAAEEVKQELREIRDGVVATDDVDVRETTVDDEGRAVAELAVTNSGEETDSYAIQVNFHDGEGDLADAVLVTVSSVASGDTARATARSHLDLPEDTTAEAVTAVRY